MTLKPSAMGHTVSMMNDTKGSPVMSTVNNNTLTMVRIQLDIHHVCGSKTTIFEALYPL